MIAMQNIIDVDKSLLTVLFNRKVLMHLKCRCNDNLIILQSNFNPNYFMLIKSDTGYRIRRYPHIKNTYQININFSFNQIPEFDIKDCSYFLKKNNSIRIILNI